MKPQRKYEIIDWFRLLLAIVLIFLLIFAYKELSDYEHTQAIESNYFNNLVSLAKAVIPNIISLLIVFVIVYIFFSRKGMSPRERLKEEIVEGITNVISDDSLPPETKHISLIMDQLSGKMPFLKSNEAYSVFEVSNKMDNAIEISILGYSSINFIRDFKSNIISSIVNGTNYKILLVNPDSDSAKVMKDNQDLQEIIPDINRTIQRLKTIQKKVEEIIKNDRKLSPGKIELKIVNWIPSCSIIIYNANSLDGELKIKLNALYLDTPPHFTAQKIIRKKDSVEWFQYFQGQFNSLWDIGTRHQFK